MRRSHVLFDRVLSSAQRLEWGEMYIRILTTVGGKWISGDARKSKREDFAESFRLYRLTPSRLQEIDPERYTFLDEIHKEIA